ncbi:MAG: hypothetical protein AAGJ56_05910 [Myxococcota bacterium]
MRRTLAFLVTTLVPAVGAGTIHQTVTLRTLLSHADRVVVGDVMECQSVRDPNGHIITQCAIALEKTLRGAPSSPGDVMVVTQFGGEVDGEIYQVLGDAKLEVGERYLFLTKRAKDGYRYLVGMQRGALRLTSDDRLGNPFPTLKDVPSELRSVSRLIADLETGERGSAR